MLSFYFLNAGVKYFIIMINDYDILYQSNVISAPDLNVSVTVLKEPTHMYVSLFKYVHEEK